MLEYKIQQKENNESTEDFTVRLERVARDHRVEMGETVWSMLTWTKYSKLSISSNSRSSNDYVYTHMVFEISI